MAWIDELNRKVAEAAHRRADPLRGMVQTIVRDKDMIGTAPLLDLLGMAKTTSNARRIGQRCVRWDLSRSNRAVLSRVAIGTQ
jgi:hypothetical protein